MNVLIVDESVEVRERVAAMLGKLRGLKIAHMGSAAKGSEYLRLAAPDIIVMDFTFPGGGSVELLGLAKSRVPPLTVFVSTNHTHCRDYCLHLGADGFFDKSLEFEALVELLKDIAGGCQSAAPMPRQNLENT